MKNITKNNQKQNQKIEKDGIEMKVKDYRVIREEENDAEIIVKERRDGGPMFIEVLHDAGVIRLGCFDSTKLDPQSNKIIHIETLKGFNRYVEKIKNRGYTEIVLTY